jgi:hypothetical protein
LKIIRKHDQILDPHHLQQASISGRSNAGGDEPLAGITVVSPARSLERASIVEVEQKRHLGVLMGRSCGNV